VEEASTLFKKLTASSFSSIFNGKAGKENAHGKKGLNEESERCEMKNIAYIHTCMQPTTNKVGAFINAFLPTSLKKFMFARGYDGVCALCSVLLFSIHHTLHSLYLLYK